MEFDKLKVYTSVNADELKPGDKVIVADTLAELKNKLSRKFKGEILTCVLDEAWCARFEIVDCNYTLAYLVERAENCTNCIYEDSAGCSVVEICGENKLTHRCHMYKTKDTKRNLCNSCKHCFADCPATPDDIIFGDGIGNDNVYECDRWEAE